MNLSPRASEFVFQALAQAAGTVLAAAVIFLVGVAAGAINDVPRQAWLAALAVVAAAFAALLAARAALKAADEMARAESELFRLRLREVMREMDVEEKGLFLDVLWEMTWKERREATESIHTAREHLDRERRRRDR